MKTFVVVLMFAALFFPAFSMAACPEGVPAGTVCIDNPLAPIGVNSPAQLVMRVIQLFSGIIGTAAVMFMVFGAFKLIIATDEESIKSARESITWSVGGFVVALLAFTTISGAGVLLGFDPGIVGDNLNQDRIDSPLSGPADPRSFLSIVNFVMVNILALIAVVTLLMIVYYGYRYITAAGNEESIEKAKTGLKWSIIGLVIAMMSYAVISIVQRLLFFGVEN